MLFVNEFIILLGGTQMKNEEIRTFMLEINNELKKNILPFWMDNVIDKKNGGFYNSITNDLKLDESADKGCILNSRILWTFSSAYRMFGDEKYLETAKIAYKYMLDFFWDDQYSGVYMVVDCKGNPIVARKQIYNLAFAIYGLAEYYRAVCINESLEKAIELFNLIEKHSFDSVNGGYIEAVTRDWKPLEDLRLSSKDANEKKSMNTHLHVLEAYTNLYRVWKDERLKERVRGLLEIMLEKVLDSSSGHFILFFDEFYNPKSNITSYGHDIEGSWLMCEAANLLDDEDIKRTTYAKALIMAEGTLSEGMDLEFGGLFSEAEHSRRSDDTKVWWVQCEAMVGFLNAYLIGGKSSYCEEANGIWNFCKKYLIDRKYGEWFWRTTRDGKVFEEHLKVEPWKCPYHNGRACMELIDRLSKCMKQ
jgi:cellobiose epimerase